MWSIALFEQVEQVNWKTVEETDFLWSVIKFAIPYFFWIPNLDEANLFEPIIRQSEEDLSEENLSEKRTGVLVRILDSKIGWWMLKAENRAHSQAERNMASQTMNNLDRKKLRSRKQLDFVT